jgi:hypothetical protein
MLKLVAETVSVVTEPVNVTERVPRTVVAPVTPSVTEISITPVPAAPPTTPPPTPVMPTIPTFVVDTEPAVRFTSHNQVIQQHEPSTQLTLESVLDAELWARSVADSLIANNF